MNIVNHPNGRQRAPYLRPDHRVVLALIDDDGGRHLILEGLSSDYSVTIASTAPEAAHLLAAFTYRLVIVTNFGMPPALALSVIPADHPYPVLFISGHFDDDLQRECALKRIRSMKMPFTLQELRAEVAATLR
jgi:DNA-binding response OmpR family regulator